MPPSEPSPQGASLSRRHFKPGEEEELRIFLERWLDLEVLEENRRIAVFGVLPKESR